ncbi:Uncharacterised protein [Mycobacteroides abscessus subsp. abscessus]|nr:Uncharacterised protein [Mycobacteroides abscessus subsp. abscessus]
MGIQPRFPASRIKCRSMVRYTACPESACPSSWPTMKRSSCSFIRSSNPDVSTMNGRSIPMV